MARTKKAEVPIKDELAAVLVDNLNKEFKDFRVAQFLSDDDVSNLEFVSIGSTTLDLAISNRPNGGLPVGRITEIMGLESSGKSLLAAHVLANTQKQGGLAVYIDTEAAVSKEFLQAIGIDLTKMLYIRNLDTVEDIFASIDKMIETIRTTSKDRLVTIVVDSIAAASTKVEMEDTYDQAGWATQKAIILSKAMRKIARLIEREKICLVFTNQLRVKIGAMFGEQYTTGGGKAIGFYSSVRMVLKSVGKIKEGNDIVGVDVVATIVKNRVGPPFRVAPFRIYFNRGLDDESGWFDVLKSYGHIKTGGSWHTIKGKDGESIKFQQKDWKNKLNEMKGFKKYVHEILCDSFIMEYKPLAEGIKISEVDIDSAISEVEES